MLYPYCRRYWYEIKLILLAFVASIHLPDSVKMVMPGDNVTCTVELAQNLAINEGLRFALREGGRTIGQGVISKIL